MGIYRCPRCGNPNGWWSGNMLDVHDCPMLHRKDMNILGNGDGNSLVNTEPNPVPTVPEYPAHDAIEIMRAWFEQRGAKFNPDEFPMERPNEQR